MKKKTTYKWESKKPTVQMLGRFQPWHKGHQKLFQKILKKTGQVYIMVKNAHGLGDNPFTFNKVKSNINAVLKKHRNRYKVVLVPNITHVCYGRTVGYRIEKIFLNKKLMTSQQLKLENFL